MKIGPIAVVLFALLSARPALAQSGEAAGPGEPAPRSRTIAYILGVGGTLAPMYLAGALYERTGPRTQLALIGGGLCWGPSLAFAYAGDWRASLVSGLGKSAVLATAVWFDGGVAPEHDEDAGHAWAGTLAAAGIAAWTAFDLIRLGYVVDRRNAERRSRRALTPYVSFDGRLGAAGFTGRF